MPSEQRNDITSQTAVPDNVKTPNGVVNLGLVTIGMSVVPLPEGTDVSTMEALRESMKGLKLHNHAMHRSGGGPRSYRRAALATAVDRIRIRAETYKRSCRTLLPKLHNCRSAY